jgi:predicted kinase
MTVDARYRSANRRALRQLAKNYGLVDMLFLLAVPRVIATTTRVRLEPWNDRARRRYRSAISIKGD